MKINKTHILLVIVAGIAIYSLFQSATIKTDVAGYYRKIDSLQNEIDSIENENELIDSHIATIDNDVNKVEGNIIILPAFGLISSPCSGKHMFPPS